MKPLKFSFLFYATALIIGILIQEYLSVFSSILLFAIPVLFLGISLWFKEAKWQFISKNIYFFGASFYLICMTMGIGAAKYYNWVKYQHNYIQYLTDSSDEVVVFTIFEKDKVGKIHTNFVVDITAVNSISCRGKAIVSLPDSLLKPGLRLMAIGRFVDFQATANLGQFDYATYMQRKQIFKRFTVKEFEVIGRENSLYFHIINFRYFLKERIEENSHFTSSTKSFLTALLLGDRTTIDGAIVSSFQRQGIMHVLAISGLHIGIIYMFLSWITIHLPKRLKMLIILVCLWIFVFLSGFSPSVFRAVFMFSLIAIRKGIGNRQSTLEVIGQALFLSLLFCPVWLFDVGFQLSYMAVIGIVWLMPLFKNCYSANRLINYVLSLIYVSIVAQISVLPLQLYYFNSLSLTFLLSNIIVIPLVTVLLIGGIIYLITAWTFSEVSEVLSFVLNKIVSVLLYLVNSIDSYSVYTQLKIYWSHNQVIILLGLIILVGIFLYQPRFRNIYFLGIYSLLAVVIICFSVNTEKQIFIIASSYKNQPMLLFPTSENLVVYGNDSLQSSSLVKSYQKYFKKQEVMMLPLQYVYQLDRDNLLLVLSDEMSYYQIDQQIDYILIQDNCKINYDRLLMNTKPKEVIIGKEMTKWYKDMLVESCLKNNIPFHDIRQKGYWCFISTL